MPDSWFKHVQLYVAGNTNFGPGDLVRKMSVTLDRSASVYVHYETQGSGKLKSKKVDTDGSNNSEVILARLRPGSEYHYTVFAESGEDVSKPYMGKFHVNPLPFDVEEGSSFNHLDGKKGELIIIDRINEIFKGLMVLEHNGVVVWYRRSYLYDPAIDSVSKICRDSEFNFIRSVEKSDIHTFSRFIVTDVFGNENEKSIDTSKRIGFKKIDVYVDQGKRIYTVPTDSIYGETIIRFDQDLLNVSLK